MAVAVTSTRNKIFSPRCLAHESPQRGRATWATPAPTTESRATSAASTRRKIFSPRPPVGNAPQPSVKITIEVPVHLASNGNLVAKEAMRPAHTAAELARKMQDLADLAEPPKLLFRGNVLQGGETIGELLVGDGDNRVLMIQSRPSIFATAGSDSVVRFWDCTSSQCTQTLRGHSAAVRSMSFSPDGRHLVTGSRDGTVLLWDIEMGNIYYRWSSPDSTYNVLSTAFGPDSKKILVGFSEGFVKILSCVTGECELALTGHSNDVLTLCMAPDGRSVVTGSRDGTAIIWNIPSGEPKHVLQEHEAAVTSVVIGPNARVLATASNDSTARVWNIETGSCEQQLRGHKAAVVSACFSPVGQFLVTCSLDQSAKIWDWSSGVCHHTLASQAAGLRSVSFTPDGKCVATGAHDGTVTLWDTMNGRRLRDWYAHKGSVNAMSFVH